MQPIQKLRESLETLTDADHYLFRASDFYPLFPDMTVEALRVLLGRAAKAGLLKRICRGVYCYPRAAYRKGFEIYHTAGLLRDDTFCYLSLESVLSETGALQT
jgi:predicted transcriptional regulator of viral defense system